MTRCLLPLCTISLLALTLAASPRTLQGRPDARARAADPASAEGAENNDTRGRGGGAPALGARVAARARLLRGAKAAARGLYHTNGDGGAPMPHECSEKDCSGTLYMYPCATDPD